MYHVCKYYTLWEIVEDFGRPICEYYVLWNITIYVIFNCMRVLLKTLQFQS